jgi:hypothetical protein
MTVLPAMERYLISSGFFSGFFQCLPDQIGDLIPDEPREGLVSVFRAVLNAADHIGAVGALSVDAAGGGDPGLGGQIRQVSNHRGGADIHSDPVGARRLISGYHAAGAGLGDLHLRDRGQVDIHIPLHVGAAALDLLPVGSQAHQTFAAAALAAAGRVEKVPRLGDHLQKGLSDLSLCSAEYLAVLKDSDVDSHLRFLHFYFTISPISAQVLLPVIFTF